MVQMMALLFAVSMGACALPDEQDSARSGTDVAALEEDVESAYYPICVDHYECCQETKLGDIRDNPGETRCGNCVKRCNDEHDGRGRWPMYTHAGWDCQYWKREHWYRQPRRECEALPR
jgi:hypothetical protein